jgi:hypothetical protein
MKFVTMCGLVGLGGGFLVISPPLRQSLYDAADKGQLFLQTNQPYSYIGVGVVLVLALGTYMYRCAQPH